MEDIINHNSNNITYSNIIEVIKNSIAKTDD